MLATTGGPLGFWCLGVPLGRPGESLRDSPLLGALWGSGVGMGRFGPGALWGPFPLWPWLCVPWVRVCVCCVRGPLGPGPGPGALGPVRGVRRPLRPHTPLGGPWRPAQLGLPEATLFSLC